MRFSHNRDPIYCSAYQSILGTEADCYPVTCQLIKKVHQRNKVHRDHTDRA